MSDVMLFGVLRMPYEMAMGDELSRRQFYSRVQEAADRLEMAERATQPADDEPTEAYWAITASGQRCAFGVKSWAEGWAGKGGRVETVQLTKLALVEPATQPAILAQQGDKQ